MADDIKKGGEFQEAPTKKLPGEQGSIVVKNRTGESGMMKKIIIGVLAVVVVLFGYMGYKAMDSNSGRKNIAENLQPQLTPDIVAQMVNAQVAPAIAALRASTEGSEVDYQDSLKSSTREKIMEGANTTASLLSLNFHQAALEEKGHDSKSAEYYANGMHFAAAMDKEFLKPIKKDQKGLIDYFRNGSKTAGVNTKEIVSLKETDKFLEETDQMLERNTLANTAGFLRRDPNSGEIEKYIKLPDLAKYGYELGLTNEMISTSYKNEMADTDKKHKKLSSRIWRNKKALGEWHSGKNLAWERNVKGTASLIARKIAFSTE